MAADFDMHMYLVGNIGTTAEDNAIKPFKISNDKISSDINEATDVSIKSLLMLESLRSVMQYI